MTYRNHLAIVTIVLVMIIAVGCAPTPIKGTVAAPFTIKVLDYDNGVASKDNRTITLASLKEKPIILYFFASW